MKEIKKRPTKYKITPQEVLDEKDAEELFIHLSEFGNQASFAREIGKTTVTVAGWMNNKKFPKYCGLYVEKLRLKKVLNIPQ